MAKTPFEQSQTLGSRVARRTGASPSGYDNTTKTVGLVIEGTFLQSDIDKAVAEALANIPEPVDATISRLQIAKVCHEANKVYCEAQDDSSQLSWEDAPDWQKESAAMGVDLHMDNDVGPEASHESWMAQKEADGWVYGEVKDPEAKAHPCMVPFDELPKDQQFKDFLFRAIVHSFK